MKIDGKNGGYSVWIQHLTLALCLLCLNSSYNLLIAADSTENTGTKPGTSQSTATNSSVTPQNKSDVKSARKDSTQLDTVIVQDIPIDESIIPQRPSVSVYGLPTSVQDTPRAISEVSKAQLETGVLSYGDLAQYSPSITRTTGNTYSTNPKIRGGDADVMQNGMRTIARTDRTFNDNSWEAADVVAGSPSVIYGASNRTAGYVNYVTKQPLFDQQKTEINTVLGKFNPGDRSYPDFTYQIDNGGPIIKDQLAYRVSYKQEQGDTYAKSGQAVYQDIYGSLGWLPNKDVSVDWNFDYSNNESSPLTQGWNRVTSDLINNGTYAAGPSTPIIKKGANYYIPNASGTFTQVTPTAGQPGKYTVTGTTINAATLNAGADKTIAAWYQDAANTTYTNLNAYDRLFSNDERASVTEFSTQLRAKVIVDDELTIANNFYYQYHRAETRSYDSINNLLDVHMGTNRTEFQLKKEYEIAGVNIEHTSNSGVEERLQYDQNFVLTSPMYSSTAFDLTQTGQEGINALLGGSAFPNSTGYVNHSIFNGANIKLPYTTYPIPELPDQYVSASNNGTGSSDRLNVIVSPSVYTYHQLKFDDQWAVTVGGRVTTIFDRVKPTMSYDPTFNGRANTTQTNWDVNGSLGYKPVPWSTLYATYDHTIALNGSPTSSPTYVNGGLNSTAFQTLSELYEAGAKFEILPRQLFTTLAGFYQTRNTVNPTTNVATLAIYRGVEAALNYQPSTSFALGANYSFIEANYGNTTPSSSPFVVSNSGTGSTITSFNSSNTTGAQMGDYRVPGLPNQNFNFFADYHLDSGFGFRPSLWVASSWNVNTLGTVQVPAQYNVDFEVYYAKDRWKVAVDFLNITNEQNYGYVADDYIMPLQPFGIQGKLSYKF